MTISFKPVGNILVNQGRYTEAASILAETLEARRRTLGAKHPETLQSLFDLGAALQAQQKYSEAEPLIAEAVDGSRETLGREHRTTLTRMERLAAVRMQLGNHDQSAALYTEALEVRMRVTGREAAETVGDMVALGAVLNRLQDFQQAEPLLREALTIREKSAPETWGRFSWGDPMVGGTCRLSGPIGASFPNSARAAVRPRWPAKSGSSGHWSRRCRWQPVNQMRTGRQRL